MDYKHNNSEFLCKFTKNRKIIYLKKHNAPNALLPFGKLLKEENRKFDQVVFYL